MKIGRWILFFIVIILFIFIFLFIFNKDLFTVKKIKVISDVKINNADFFKKINVKKGYYIWQYDIESIKRNVDRLFIFDSVKVSKKFPDLIQIELKMRVPLGRVVGKGGVPYLLDKRGVVYSSSRVGGNIPLLIVDTSNEVLPGRKLTGRYTEIIQFLWIMKNKYDIYYSSISQIEIENSNNQFSYHFNFRTINKTITLKKNLNVENIIDAFSIAYFSDWSNSGYAEVSIIDKGVFYKREE
ncbi:MAG: hypothetical protein A2015_07535 [Spirochaetes bacterium GWF1_31_7]|nr:MAG: hypothetical protein A2Y30_02915 [Spirochaetes bacterium GWE1_32_154]OHD47608.1 MAG: hypothetical protein A2Y29_00360 [Spirochaetes bacterium GWE2_31_10]OHD51269.1 MAG: hypothetical protein A2015_07535 [Spirochaetes bacterium GWF1_31_7]HBD96166.1 hypothetical protein [Spirochaetia bacterium]HBI37374.1 hypothetical protein [Spirochaetia bacterium]